MIPGLFEISCGRKTIRSRYALIFSLTSVSMSGLRENAVADAEINFPDFNSRIIPSWITSV
jgi:hypothetical protein